MSLTFKVGIITAAYFFLMKVGRERKEGRITEGQCYPVTAMNAVHCNKSTYHDICAFLPSYFLPTTIPKMCKLKIEMVQEKKKNGETWHM